MLHLFAVWPNVSDGDYSSNTEYFDEATQIWKNDKSGLNLPSLHYPDGKAVLFAMVKYNEDEVGQTTTQIPIDKVMHLDIKKGAGIFSKLFIFSYIKV